MSHIKVKLMGIPTVTVDNVAVKFPYNKAAGLFYYLCVRTTVSREEGASVFWADSDEKTSRKNLRDVIYKIKKIFGEQILHIQGNSVIKLNRDCNIEIDIEKINEENIVDLYSGDFLDHFYIKNCKEFENWCENVRTYFREMYIAGLYKKMHNAAKEKDITTIKEYAAILIQNDIYDEKMYRGIMQLYSGLGHYNLAIKIYYKLKEVLHEDLNESPATETQILFENILKLKKTSDSSQNSDEEYFYERFEETFRVTKQLEHFLHGRSKTVLISGEAGAGKTAMLEKTAKLIDDSCAVLRYVCSYQERGFYYKAWYSLLEQIEALLEKESDEKSLQQQFLHEYLEHSQDSAQSFSSTNIELGRTSNLKAFVVGDSLLKLARQKKVVLLIDDLQWLDTASLALLYSVIFDLGNKKIMLIATHRDDYSRDLGKFIINLKGEDSVETIKLKRFSYEETGAIIKALAPEMYDEADTVKNIYKETAGNALFLTELIMALRNSEVYFNFLSPKAINVIESRLIDLNREENEVIDAIALFDGGASMSDLKIFLPIVEFEIFEIIESLMEKKLIKEEVVHKDVYFLFNHQKFQEYTHDRQSVAKRTALHRKIAGEYEKKITQKRKMYLYPKLIYHFEESGNKYKAYLYIIQYLNEYYYTFQETFPHLRMLDTESEEYKQVDFAEENLVNILTEVKANSDSSLEYAALEMQIYFVMGRYSIYSGKYEEGLNSIKESCRIAKELGDYKYLFKNYKQYIYYSIQVSDFDRMKKYIDLCEEIMAELSDYEKEEHILCRLKGLYLIEKGHIGDARKLLSDTVATLQSNGHSGENSVDLAVCYNYLGLCFMGENLWETGYEYFLKAINLCNKTPITNAVGIFHSNAAHALYELSRYEEARKHNEMGLSSFKTTGALWGRAKAEIYATLIELELGGVEKAKLYFDKAKKTNTKLNNPQHLKQIEDIADNFHFPIS